MFSELRPNSARPSLRLVASNGQRLDQQWEKTAPEAIMIVSFRGLTEAEQRVALSAFPGGRRFRLAGGAK